MKKKSWNIDKCRNEFEPDEQWELKRKFLEVNKNILPRDRLVCLAQVLVNIEFLGTKYPNETMKTVAELSQGIVEEFREKQKTRLQRTFVGAADAASARLRGVQPSSTLHCRDLSIKKSNDLKNTTAGQSNSVETKDAKEPNIPTKIGENGKQLCFGWKGLNVEFPRNVWIGNDENQAISFVSKQLTTKKRKRNQPVSAVEIITSNDNDPGVCVISNDTCTKEQTEESGTQIIKPKKKKKKKKKKDHSVESIEQSVVESTTSEGLQANQCANKNGVTTESGPPNFVLIMRRSDKKSAKYRQIIESSARLSRVKTEVSQELLQDQLTREAILYLDGKVIATAQQKNLKLCLQIMFKCAYINLKKTHYQVIIEDPTYISVEHFVKMEEEAWNPRVGKKLSPTITLDSIGNEKIKFNEESSVNSTANSSIAMKMMKSMGWAEGSGLGANNQGIVEAIKADVIVGRKGLGFDGCWDDKNLPHLVRRYLQEYISANSAHKIFFSNEFSTNQRKLIHSVSRQMGLKSTSFGKEPNRQLLVQHFEYQPQPLIKLLDLLKRTKKSDPLFEKVSLVPPKGGTSADVQCFRDLPNTVVRFDYD